MSLVDIKCYSVSLTHKKQTKTRKKNNNMAQKKESKKDAKVKVKVRDLKPKKDAKGGGYHGFHGGH